MEEEIKGPKIGAGALSAMGRAGFKELSQALVALPDSNIRPVEEPGLPGNLTQALVTEQMAGPQGFDAMVSSYADRVTPPRENDQGLER